MDVLGQCVDGVKLENLIGVDGAPNAQLSRKIRHYDRNNLAGIRITHKPFNLQFRLLQMVVRSLGIFDGTMLKSLQKLR